MKRADSELSKVGYARYDLAGHLVIASDDWRYQSLKTAFDDLPEDPYAKGSGRYRRYGRGVFFPWSSEFSWIPPVRSRSGKRINGYYQGDNNPDYPGVVRHLAAIGQSALDNDLLIELIAFDFAQTRWSETDSVWPLHVGVHLIKLEVTDEVAEAYSSPNELHQDGEPFVFAHLIYRHNVGGGYNLIAPPRYRGLQPEQVPAADRLAEFELTKPLESYGVTDHLASHYVAPIHKLTGSDPGVRAVILTDFVPMRQRI